MADEKKEAPAAEKAAEKPAAKAEAKKGGAAKYIFLGLCFGASSWFVYPTYVLLVGMLPTVVALFTSSDDRQGSSITAIGTLNLAGIFPFVIELWQKGQTLENALAILSVPETWLIMFGAAAVGQLILFAVPQAIASAAFARGEARIKLLKEHLEVLKVTWGPDVATTKPMEKIVRGE